MSLTRRLLSALSAAILLVVLSPASPASAHVFGPFLLQNATTGMCADLPWTGLGTVNGPVNQYWCTAGPADNQRWYLETRSSFGTTALFWIKNVKDGLCMDVPYAGAVAAGTLVSEFYCIDNDNQYFYLSTRPDGRVWFVNYTSGLCLDVAGYGGSGGPDARLTLHYCSETDDHFWYTVTVA